MTKPRPWLDFVQDPLGKPRDWQKRGEAEACWGGRGDTGESEDEVSHVQRVPRLKQKDLVDHQILGMSTELKVQGQTEKSEARWERTKQIWRS